MHTLLSHLSPVSPERHASRQTSPRALSPHHSSQSLQSEGQPIPCRVDEEGEGVTVAGL